MSRSVNKAQILGNVGSEPECKTTASGKFVAHFSVATSYGQGDKERTQWHRIVCWEKTAEIVQQFVHKGDRIFLEGSIEYSKTDDGKFFTDIIAREVVLLSGKKD
jgi:single-strand DNA-binding protein